MFKNPFSIKGRIRRAEYAISILGVIVVFIGLIITLTTLFQPEPLVIVLLSLPLYGFRVVQGVKRCHDIGVSGWRQFIPFYTIVLLVENSEVGPNKYGLNPKGIGNVDGFHFKF